MTQAISKEQIILDKLQALNSQQQQEVLDFIEFLYSRNQKQTIPEETTEPISVLESAGEFIGCVDSGQGDLSLQKRKLKQGYSPR